MKKTMLQFILLLFIFSFVAGVITHHYNTQPVPKHAVTVTDTVRGIVTTFGHWKMGAFPVGYRIITDSYVLVSGTEGLLGQQGSFGGPGMVDYKVINSFDPIAKFAVRIEGRDRMQFNGDQLYDESGNAFLFEGKKVVMLFTARHADSSYEVNRRPF